MQKQKWHSIPERNRDVYNKIPALMNMEKEWVHAKPEKLPEKTYHMSRVASDLLSLSDFFLKISKL